MKGLLAVAVGTVAVALGQAGVADAATQAFTPTDDAYVTYASPNANYGSSTALWARTGSYPETTYLKFGVAGVSGTITGARLRLWVTDPSPAGGTLYRVGSSSWTQSGITWRTAPAVGTAVAGVGAVAASTWVEFNLGNAVAANGTYSFALKGASSDRAVYTSREGASKPQLVLTYGPSLPANIARPTVSGNAEELSTLSAGPGSWNGYPAPTYAYQWQRCDAQGGACADVAGATGTTYALGFPQVGSTFRVRVTATNSAGSTVADSAPTAPVRAVSLALPVRAAFYYGWYPENWVPGTHFTPSLGQYDSGSQTTIKQHISALQYAGVRAGIYSWWGLNNTGNNSTQRFPSYLTAAQGTGFKWAVYYENEGYANPTAPEIESDLKYIRDTYATSPNYLRVAGRPVVFVYPGAGDGCDMADRWKAGNTVGDYVVLGTSWVDNAPQLASLTPYDAPFTAGVRVAAADLNGDGKAEIVTAPGAGGPATINVLDGAGTRLASFVDAASGTKGAFVAVGDVSGDSKPEIVVGTGNGATPTISVYSYDAGTVSLVRSFDPGLANAMRVAVGDVTGDGKGDIVATTGPGIPASVKVFAGDGTLESSLAPYDSTFTKGAYVATGDVNGDGRAEIVLGDGNGTHNEVRIVDASGAAVIAPFEAYTGFGGGISVAVGDVDGDGQRDVVTGASGGPHVRSFTLREGRPSGLESLFAFDSSTSGQIWVAAADVAGEGTADIVAGSALGQPGQAKVLGNVRDCASQPDAWHEYLVTASGEAGLGRSSFTIAPGFWSASDAAAALPRDPARWSANVAALTASGADWQLLLSFNEWGEGTSVESANEWATTSGFGTYLDLLRGVAPVSGKPPVAGTAPDSGGAAPGGGEGAPPASFPRG